ncbi:MAG: RagB/SusD family nutrient uptake outer membrane protein [Bacteroidales bacterium]|nr:RagB/SusD family nutrient uptake outer membrane protein [Bacteroidales bacterium]
MKRFIYNTAVALGVLLGASSCDGFLDRIPTDSVVSESAMATLADAEVVANGLYTDLKYYTMYGSYIPYMGDMRGDNLYPTNASGTGRTIYTLEYEPVQSTYFGMWQNYYTTIMRANTLIANIETIPVMSSADQEKKDDILGQALAIRALCHWDIARLYGYPYMKDNGASLGAVVLTEVVAPSESKLPRNTVAETYAQVEKDLTLALTKLSKSKNDGHFNYWAARMLQAKVALYKGDWQTAYTAASEVVESSPYRMVPNSEYLAYWGKQCDDESVLEFLVTNTGDIDSDGGFYTMYHNMWFEDKAAGADIIPSKAWKDLFANTPNDVRAQMIAYDDPVTGAIKSGEYWLKKFIGNKDLGYTFRRNNPRIFRITDAYLMAAEAALELAGKQDIANEYLNAVVKRADPTAADVVATLDRIQIERQKEFIGEGHRFFDVLRRGGKIVKDASLDDRDFAGNTRQEIDWNDHRVVLPISHNEIMLYPELEQNPGY